jgi:hypothetical protein
MVHFTRLARSRRAPRLAGFLTLFQAEYGLDRYGASIRLRDLCLRRRARGVPEHEHVFSVLSLGGSASASLCARNWIDRKSLATRFDVLTLDPDRPTLAFAGAAVFDLAYAIQPAGCPFVGMLPLPSKWARPVRSWARHLGRGLPAEDRNSRQNERG